MRTKQLILFYLLCICFTGCSLMPNELKKVEDLIENQPDSALQILRNISPDKNMSGTTRALYGLLMTETLDQKKLPLKPDSLLDFSIAYYEEHPDKDRLATCYLYKGRAYKYNFQYEDATTCYLKAEDAVTDSENYLLLGKINSDIADIYLYQREYKKARQKYSEAYRYYRKAKSNKLSFTALINIGKSYSQAKSYKKALPYFQKVSKECSDSTIKVLALQHIGINYYNFNQLDSALFYLRKVIKYPAVNHNRAVRHYYIADVFMDLNQVDSAYYYAKNAFNYEPDIRTQRECYRILANVANSKSNMTELQKYMSSYQDCSDSIQKIDAQTKGSILETIHASKKEISRNEQKVWFLRGLILLLAVVAYAFSIFVTRRTKKEKMQIQEIHTEEKAGIRKKVIVDKRTVLQQKIEEIKTKQIHERKLLDVQEREAQIRKIYEDLLHINDQAFFFSEMDVVLNGLITKLRSRYPGIKPKELIWCCLYLFKIPSHDMLILLDYKSHNSLKMLKGRLSDKFELDNAALLGSFLKSILYED